MKIRRKFCNLHGWAPHETRAIGTWGASEVGTKICCRCYPDNAFTLATKTKAFFRGFKLPDSIRAKDFLAQHIKRISQ